MQDQGEVQEEFIFDPEGRILLEMRDPGLESASRITCPDEATKARRAKID